MSESRQLTEEIKVTIRTDFARFSNAMPGFIMRPAQWDMIASSAKVLGVEHGAGMIDAPTGIGKSLAYLIAAVPVAKAHDKKLIISTGTVALQEQLVNKDIPLYSKFLAPDLKVAIAKGRSRYVCPRNLMELAGNSQQTHIPGLEDEPIWTRPPREGEVELVHFLADQLSNARWDGDLDNSPKDIPAAIKPMITTTSAACSGQRCPFAKVCPFLKARQEIEKADVIVANHALVMADLQMFSDDGPGGVILTAPQDTLYVFDEGHHLERAAIDANANSVAITTLFDQIKKHDRPIRQAFRQLKTDSIDGVSQVQVLSDIKKYQQSVSYMETAIYSIWTPEPGQYDPTWTAPLGVLPQPLVDLATELASLSAGIERATAILIKHITKADLADSIINKHGRDLGHLQDAYNSQYQLWHQWQCPDDDALMPKARWASQKGRILSVHASPISAHDVLNDCLWPNASAVLLTSATLAIGGSFTNIRDHLGAPEKTLTRKLESPFPISTNGQILIPWIKPLPNEGERHTTAVVSWLIKENQWKKANLVLFTSKKKMQAVYDALPESLKSTIKMQADGVNKAKLLAEHAADIKAGQGSTLFGLESFGTGLDLPGDLCTTVVITQLPFSVPSDPVGMTLSAYCQSKRGNPFHDITIPDTIRTMTQYAGRLLRTENDKGRVVVLDRRLVLNSYGRTILKAMPPFQCKTEKPNYAEEAV